jgi:hypothetical protein
VWTGVQNVGDVAAFSVPGVSRDSYVFGVRALDANGRRSVVTFCASRRA